MILKIVNYPLESERETVSEQFQGSWRLGTAQALHAQYKYVSSVDIRHLGTPYERVPRFLSTRELMVGNLRDSEAARYVLLQSEIAKAIEDMEVDVTVPELTRLIEDTDTDGSGELA